MSSPIWVMCRGVVCLKLFGDGSSALSKTVSYHLRRSLGAARYGQDCEVVIHGNHGETDLLIQSGTSEFLCCNAWNAVPGSDPVPMGRGGARRRARGARAQAARQTPERAAESFEASGLRLGLLLETAEDRRDGRSVLGGCEECLQRHHQHRGGDEGHDVGHDPGDEIPD
jgi:hypothetical protein